MKIENLRNGRRRHLDYLKMLDDNLRLLSLKMFYQAYPTIITHKLNKNTTCVEMEHTILMYVIMRKNDTFAAAILDF